MSHQPGNYALFATLTVFSMALCLIASPSLKSLEAFDSPIPLSIEVMASSGNSSVDHRIGPPLLNLTYIRASLREDFQNQVPADLLEGMLGEVSGTSGTCIKGLGHVV